MRLDRHRLEYAHPALVEEPPQQPLARERGVEQLVILDGLDQRLRLDPGIVLFHFVLRRAFRRVARIDIALLRWRCCWRS